MTTLQSGKPVSGLAPITPNATKETRDLLHYICALSGSDKFLIGAHERYDLAAYAPAGMGADANFQEMTGDSPGFLHYEYQAPDQVCTNVAAANGPACYNNMVAEIKSFHERGGINCVHNHWGNPTLAGGLKVAMSDVLNYTNRNNSPLASVKTGGAQEAQLLAYLDNMVTFFNSLVDSEGKKIPILFRPQHEQNITSFWWNGIDRQADCVIVWQKIVDYLRSAGVTNVLYVWNLVAKRDSMTDNAVNPYSGWYPGDNYCDVVSLDWYNDQTYEPNRSFSALTPDNLSSYEAMLAIAAPAGKPVTLAEAGYEHAANLSPDIWERLGKEISTSMRYVSMVGLWRPTWGPQPGTVGGDSLGRAVNSQEPIITLSRIVR